MKKTYPKTLEGAVALRSDKEQEALEKWRKSYMATQQYFLKYEKAKAATARAVARWEKETEEEAKHDKCKCGHSLKHEHDKYGCVYLSCRETCPEIR